MSCLDASLVSNSWLFIYTYPVLSEKIKSVKYFLCVLVAKQHNITDVHGLTG